MFDREFFSKKLATHLISQNILDPATTENALQDALKNDISLITWLATRKILSDELLMQSCAAICHLPCFQLELHDEKRLCHSELNSRFMRQYRFVPIRTTGRALHIGIADPCCQPAIDVIRFQTGLDVVLHLVPFHALARFIDKHCHTSHEELVDKMKIDSMDENLQDHSDNDPAIQDEPLIRFVDTLIHTARASEVSDIHIEPGQNICRIRYRQYGVLRIAQEIPGELAGRITSRLKVIARLDIAEKRIPQDGRFKFDSIDIRISTCPVYSGEKTVLRLLNASQKMPDMESAGFTEAQKKTFRKILSQPQGMVLVTGPTGSGKTVTLYTALNFLNQPQKNISTVEDPVEIRLAGINQVNINPKIGLDFARTLRALLRQDPDIIMIGEIRDAETAHIATQAAQTGHLVLSTLHTNNAVETVMRLQTMQVPPGYIADTVKLVIAQRLVRVLCVHCKKPDEIFSGQTIFKAHGCHQCAQGYTGRTAIFEFLQITDKLSSAIASAADPGTLRKIAGEENFISLNTVGLEKVMSGITSRAELARVLET